MGRVQRVNNVKIRAEYRIVNASEDFTRAVLREILVTRQLYDLAMAINSNSEFSFQTGSYISKRWTHPWGYSRLNTKMLYITKKLGSIIEFF